MHKLPIVLAFAVFAGLALSPAAQGKDKSDKYQLGIFLSAGGAEDGTTTTTTGCEDKIFGGVECTGTGQNNTVTIYRVRTTGGVWQFETYREASDTSFRKTFNEEPSHFKSEKQNPLDLLKNGDRVLFRVERHQKLNGVETDAFIPFADNPNKEAKFVGTFFPDAGPSTPSDNVAAMCAAHKLTPEQQKQFCTPAPESAAPAANLQTPANSETHAPSGVVYPPTDPTSDPNEMVQLGKMVLNHLASFCAVYTTPSGAEVYVDGMKVGVAPITFVLLRQGDTARIITIKRDGYKTIERQVIPDGTTVPLELTLETQ